LKVVVSRTPEETRALGQCLGRLLGAGQVIALRGELGAGKTTFIQGLAAGMGVAQRVTSPTFILVNQYQNQNGPSLVHVDSYRLGEAAEQAALEAAAFGLEEILATSEAVSRGTPDAADGFVVVIEWAERVAALLPADHLRVTLAHVRGHETMRRIEFAATGPRSAALLDAFHTESRRARCPSS
jgi:tRNA threonylcarbamoyladenosine biosynthesis protein TsaE